MIELDTTNMCSHLQKKLFQPDGIYFPVWEAMKDDNGITVMIRSRQLHIYRNGTKVLILAGKAKPKFICEDTLCDLLKSAELWINRIETEAWKAMEGDRAELPKAVLEAYKENLKLFEAGDTLSGGVSTIAAYGHTPGHTVFQKDSILIIADLMHGAALQLEHPEYCPFFDMDPEAATEARIRILKYAKENGLKMYGMHLPNPGYIE